jgi:ribonuclease-3
MTELKAWVVSRKVLAAAGRELGLDQAARLGHGLDASALPDSVLANLYEACLGAVYIDAGIEAARAFVAATLAGPLENARAARLERNPKQRLQELCQLRTGTPPTYVLLEERGDAHARAFLVAAEISGRRFPSAWGRTRREAEGAAAHEALAVLQAEESAA